MSVILGRSNGGEGEEEEGGERRGELVRGDDNSRG